MDEIDAGVLYKTCNMFSLIKEGMVSLYKGMSLLLRKCVFDIDTHVYLCHVIVSL